MTDVVNRCGFRALSFSLVVHIPGQPVCDPVDDLNERQEAEPEAQSHETPKLKGRHVFFSFSQS